MKKLLERFCRYVQVETTAVEETDDYPSSAGQLELGRMLVDELKALKLEDVTMSERGIIMATISGNQDNVPTIAWLAHMDTSPEASGKDVKPIVHKDYNGRDIVLPGDPKQVIRVEETEQLRDMVGQTIITSDGTTLLGADDKSGVAVVMTAADYLMAHPEIKHGPIRERLQASTRQWILYLPSHRAVARDTGPMPQRPYRLPEGQSVFSPL